MSGRCIRGRHLRDSITANKCQRKLWIRINHVSKRRDMKRRSKLQSSSKEEREQAEEVQRNVPYKSVYEHLFQQPNIIANLNFMRDMKNKQRIKEKRRRTFPCFSSPEASTPKPGNASTHITPHIPPSLFAS
jgi:hypothetical protein